MAANGGDKEAESAQRGVQGKGRLEAVRGVRTVTEIAQQHGVDPVMLGQWKKKILARAGTYSKGSGAENGSGT
jgi:transposase